MLTISASTLENWIREFERFAPGVDVQVYYGSQPERAAIRDDLKRRFRSGKLGVVLASYTQVTSNDDLSFFRKKIDFEVGPGCRACDSSRADDSDLYLRRRSQAQELCDQGVHRPSFHQAQMAIACSRVHPCKTTCKSWS